MGIVTTHRDGRVVTHSTDDAGSIEVVQLPSRDAAVQAATPATPDPAATAVPTADTADASTPKAHAHTRRL